MYRTLHDVLHFVRYYQIIGATKFHKGWEKKRMPVGISIVLEFALVG